MVFHIVKDIDDYYSYLMHKQWSNKLIICYFTASWCGPCKMISPDIETLGNEADNVLVLKIDVDDCEEVSSQCKIDCMPTFKFHLKNSIEPVAELMGADKTKLFNIIGELLSNLSVIEDPVENIITNRNANNNANANTNANKNANTNNIHEKLNQQQMELMKQMELIKQMETNGNKWK